MVSEGLSDRQFSLCVGGWGDSRVHGRHLHLKAVSTTTSDHTLTIPQDHRRNRIVCFLPSESNLSGPSLPDMLTPPRSLASAHPCTCETSYIKRNEQEPALRRLSIVVNFKKLELWIRKLEKLRIWRDLKAAEAEHQHPSFASDESYQLAKRQPHYPDLRHLKFCRVKYGTACTNSILVALRYTDFLS